MFFKKTPAEPERPVTPPLPGFKMRDFTVDELLKYNGTDDERILLAVAGRVGFQIFIVYLPYLDLRCYSWKVFLWSGQCLRG